MAVHQCSSGTIIELKLLPLLFLFHILVAMINGSVIDFISITSLHCGTRHGLIFGFIDR